MRAKQLKLINIININDGTQRYRELWCRGIPHRDVCTRDEMRFIYIYTTTAQRISFCKNNSWAGMEEII